MPMTCNFSKCAIFHTFEEGFCSTSWRTRSLSSAGNLRAFQGRVTKTTHPLCTVGEQVAGEGVPQDAELVLADVLDAVEILGVRARGHTVHVPIPDNGFIVMDEQILNDERLLP